MIQLYEVTKRFGSFQAVDHVTLTIEPGQIFGLLGANGAGKTTLIRMMCGILPPTSGSGQVLQYDLTKESAKIRQNIGYMSQKFSLYPDLTVKENLRFYARLYGVAQVNQRLEESLERYRLVEVAEKQVNQLGSGIRQRVAFATSTVHEPSLLFLDEPTSGVDPLTRQLFWEECYALTELGTTIVITTHYMDEAERCDQVALMNRGQIVAIGEVDALKEEFAPLLAIEDPTLDDIFVYVMSQGGTNGGQEELG
ncbi:ABC transporter ATP-binding protein [Laceyella putida]|uniref:ABC transporter ATP-binding protein n=1 Tax=Laceyella putida TaxID=110101 RepID=A0ABW2RLG7_9BACL